MNRKNDLKKENKILEFKHNLNVSNNIPSFKLKTFLLLAFLLLLALIVRMAYLQFVNGKMLKQKAFAQLSYTETISANRGSIYDSTGTVLATSYAADNVVIVPSKFEGDTQKELSSAVLATIFELDYNEVLTQLNSTKTRITLVKNASKDKVDTLNEWIEDNDVPYGAIYTEDSVARYYPYSTLASNVIGFCGTDSQGLSGIEYSWDSVLTGTAGKSVSSKDASQSQIPNTEETYIPAENGYDLTLTIDVNIQSIVEKYLKQAVEENDCSRGGTTIVMDPSTGDILAMASYPNFDLNTPFTPNSYISEGWDNLTTSERSTLLQRMWNNKCITDTYEPGSVFKTITAAVALEENVVGVDNPNDFYCSRVEVVADRSIKCWRTRPHGAQSLRDAYNNSCNPSFIQLGRLVGTTNLYKYFEAFGFFTKTGISLSGEASGIFFDIDDVGPVQLATMSFGQRFTITPLQMVSSISALVNDGILMQPRIVKSITNTDTGETTTISTTAVRQVVSKDTSENIKSMMQSEVEVGTGKRGLVAGYTVGGKTGTSEPSQSNLEEGYVASFVGIGPVENTKIVVLTCLYDPQGNSHQGGEIAAPVVSKIFSEVLPYLGVSSNADKSNVHNNTSDSNLY